MAFHTSKFDEAAVGNPPPPDSLELKISELDTLECLKCILALDPVLLDIHKAGKQKYEDRISVDDDKVWASENHGLRYGLDTLPYPLVVQVDDDLTVSNMNIVPTIVKVIQYILAYLSGNTPPLVPPEPPIPPEEKKKKPKKSKGNCNRIKKCCLGCDSRDPPVPKDDPCPVELSFEAIEQCPCYVARKNTADALCCLDGVTARTCDNGSAAIFAGGHCPFDNVDACPDYQARKGTAAADPCLMSSNWDDYEIV